MIIYLKILKIIVQNHIDLNYEILQSYKDNLDILFKYIFNEIDEEDIDTFIYYLLSNCTENINFHKHIFPSFEVILYKLFNKISFLNYCCQKDWRFIIINLNTIKKHLDANTYTYFIGTIQSDNHAFKNINHLEHKILYQFYDAIPTNLANDDFDRYTFEKLILLPATQTKLLEYLAYCLPLIFKTSNLNIRYLDKGIGSMNHTFIIHDLVIKIGNNRANFHIINHYRLNQWLVRKRFKQNNTDNFIYLDISPLGYFENITDNDLQDTLFDLFQANLVLNDQKRENFAIVNYDIPNNLFRDIDGIIENRTMPYSESFIKKKVKIIDQDFIYDKNNKNQRYSL